MHHQMDFEIEEFRITKDFNANDKEKISGTFEKTF